MTVTGIAAVSVISGQELAKRQDTSFQKSAPSAQTQPLADQDSDAIIQDTVSFGGNQSGMADVPDYSRYLQQSNLAAITAYEASQPKIQRQALSESGEQASLEVQRKTSM